MGRVVATGCLSHSPGITAFPDRADPAAAGRVLSALSELKVFLARSAPDALVVFSAEHFTNFSMANLPTFAVGTADSYEMPASDAFAAFLGIPRRAYPGAAGLGEAMHRGLVHAGFDVSLVAGGYGFDEGFAVPLAVLCGDTAVPVVPVVLNAVQPPYPPLARCRALGEAVGEVIAAQDRAGRVAVLGTGGLSHWVGLARAGEIDTEFDKRVLTALEAGDLDALCAISDADIDAAGNGAHEVRAWIAAAAAGGAAFDILAYEPVPAWLTGTCVARGRVAEERRMR